MYKYFEIHLPNDNNIDENIKKYIKEYKIKKPYICKTPHKTVITGQQGILRLSSISVYIYH